MFIERNNLDGIQSSREYFFMKEKGERYDVELMKNEFNFSSVREKFLKYYFKIKIKSLVENKICFMVY